MPTRVGDIVISCSGSEPSLCSLWQVDVDLQQTRDPSAYVSATHGRQAALTLSTMMANESRGAVYLFDETTMTWTLLAVRSLVIRWRQTSPARE